MANKKATEKIMDALSMLLEGFTELQDSVEEELGSDEDSDDDTDATENPDIESGIIAELRIALESVIETEDYTTEDFAALISTLTETLEEIDPEIFEQDDSESDEDEYDDEDDDDDSEDDEDLDDDDYEEVEDDDEESEGEEDTKKRK